MFTVITETVQVTIPATVLQGLSMEMDIAAMLRTVVPAPVKTVRSSRPGVYSETVDGELIDAYPAPTLPGTEDLTWTLVYAWAVNQPSPTIAGEE